jgi:hypothetical protein
MGWKCDLLICNLKIASASFWVLNMIEIRRSSYLGLLIENEVNANLLEKQIYRFVEAIFFPTEVIL